MSTSFEHSPRIALVSTHGYVAADPPLGAADTGGQVVYVLDLGKKLAQLAISSISE
jgi:mannosylfructose-phosphate synthase